MGDRPGDPSLARDHSLALEERLVGMLRADGGGLGPTSFAGLISGGHPTKLNEYASLAMPEPGDAAPAAHLHRLVSGVSRLLPDGVQLEHKLEVQLVQGPAAAAQQAQAAPPSGRRLQGWLDLEAGRPPARGPSPAPPPAVEQAQAAPVPGQPLRIRLRIPRAGSEPARADPQQQVLQATRQLAADPLLSPIPGCWAETLRLSPERQAAPAPPQQQQQQRGQGSQQAAAAPPSRHAKSPSPFASAAAERREHSASAAAAEQARQQGATEPHPQPQQSRPAPQPPKAATKRPAEPTPAASAPLQAAPPGPAAPAGAAGQEGSPPPKRQRSAATADAAAPAFQQQRAGPPAAAAAAGLAAVAAHLPAVFEAGAGGGPGGSASVQELQREGKKLKKFSEKKMKDGKPTHISSMFLCQSCVKFLEAAAALEAQPTKFSRESTSSMYIQTAGLLDSCAHNAARAGGPAAITRAIALLAQRLAAVARLRSTFCLRAEGAQQAAAFKAALEKGSGETYQRPSPTDSNTSTSLSLALEPAVRAAAAGPAAAAATADAAAPPAAADASAAAAAAALPAVPMVGMPKALLERQLLATRRAQDMLGALSALGKSGERLREYLAQQAAQNSVAGLKAAAATLLLSADAGMGPAAAILALAKEALAAVMQMS